MRHAHSCVYNGHMKDRVNTYLAILIITIACAAATLVVIRIYIARTTTVTPDSEASYAPLREEILNQ